MKRSVFSHAVLGLVLVAGFIAIPLDVLAQQSYPAGEETPRRVVFQVGAGMTVPLLHLYASNDVDEAGYARPGNMVSFRAYIPLKPRIDLMVDIALPRFSVDGDKFEEGTRTLIDQEFYKGKTLSMGVRWFLYSSPSRKGFVMASAGMYHLIFDRFLNGRRDKYTVINGAFKLGGAVGGGMEFRLRDDIVIDGVLRYHHYSDTGYFGEGSLAWLEIGLQFAFGGG